MTALPGTPCTRSTIDRWYIWYDIIQLYIIYTYMWHMNMNMYVCMSVCMYLYIYIYDTGSLHKTPMRRYELAKIRIVTRICMYVYVRWYKCIDIQNSQLQHLYMCRSKYFRRAAVGVDCSFGLAKSQTPWLGPSLSWWMKMVSWCDHFVTFLTFGAPRVGYQLGAPKWDFCCQSWAPHLPVPLKKNWPISIHGHTHTHKNHETWFAYSQQAPMLTTWIDTILDSFIFALTRGSRWGFKAGI